MQRVTELTWVYVLFQRALTHDTHIEFCCGTPPSCLKVMGWVVGGGGGLEQSSVSPRPLGFGFGTWLGSSLGGFGVLGLRFGGSA